MSMRPPVMKVKLFADWDFGDHPRSRLALLRMMEALSLISEQYLIDNPATPSIYVPWNLPGLKFMEYIPEVTTEEWLDIPTMIDEGGGDCEDLACARVAEYRRMGIPAKPHVKWRVMGDRSNRFHALTAVPLADPRVQQMVAANPMLFTNQPWVDETNGAVYAIEDPSERLGMGKYDAYLGGKQKPVETVRTLLAEAADAEASGNTKAAVTLRLRARQFSEEKGLL